MNSQILSQIKSLEEYNNLIEEYYDKESITDKIKEYDTALLKDDMVYIVSKITQKYVTLTYFNQETGQLDENRITKNSIKDYDIITIKDNNDNQESEIIEDNNDNQEVLETNDNQESIIDEAKVEENNKRLYIKTLLSNLRTGTEVRFIGNKVYENELKQVVNPILNNFTCKVLWVGLDSEAVKIMRLDKPSETYYCEVTDLEY